jgi:hypothetical protein
MKKIAFILAVFISFLFLQKNIAIPPDAPIAPQDMQKMLGIGFNANWLAFPRQYNIYSAKILEDVAAKGFNNIRLRTDELANQELFTKCDRILNDIFANDLIPILAHSGTIAENMLNEGDEEGAKQRVMDFWISSTEYYKNTSHKLIFDLMVEIGGGVLSDSPELLNEWYKDIVDTIRAISPTRIICLSPVGTSYPDHLYKLVIPDVLDEYLMVQTHFYASGPKPDPNFTRKLWHLDIDGGPTAEDKKRITDLIDAAVSWQDSTGILAWIGEWMPGNYNRGNDYSVSEQVVFTQFVVTELEKAGIPWSLNTVHKFYDAETTSWSTYLEPVLQELISPSLSLNKQESSFVKINSYPNPFHSTTIIEFCVNTNEPVYLEIFNSSGQSISKLINGTVLEKGTHKIKLDGSNLIAGIYFCHLRVGNALYSKKISLIK